MNLLIRGAAVVLVPAAVLTVAACSTGGNNDATGTASPSVATTGASPVISVKGTYVPAPGGSPSASAAEPAYTYDSALVPTGATAELTLTSRPGAMTVALKVAGFRPRQAYGTHLHAKPCGPDAQDAGSHYQYHPDPAASQSPSVDPQFANAQNEVWLDFTTNVSGAATVSTQQDWAPAGDRRPRSLVVHAETTKTEPGKAGTAGARVSCLTIP